MLILISWIKESVNEIFVFHLMQENKVKEIKTDITILNIISFSTLFNRRYNCWKYSKG